MTDQHTHEQMDALRFGIETSIRYHRYRSQFFRYLNGVFVFITLLSGSAIFVQVVGHTQLFGLIVTVIALVELISGISRRAYDHDLLRTRFLGLDSDIRQTRTPKEEEINDWIEKRIVIEREEPPTYWALNVYCYNETLLEWGRDRRLVIKMPLFQIWLKNWFRFTHQIYMFPGRDAAE